MSVYHFVGTYCEIYDTPFKFTKFGQKIEIPDDVAREAKAQGAALVSAEHFKTVGFTEDELKKYREVVTHASAPDEFLKKRTAAWKLVHEPPKGAPKAAPKETSVSQEAK